jgi:hypothetical protein
LNKFLGVLPVPVVIVLGYSIKKLKKENKNNHTYIYIERKITTEHTRIYTVLIHQ